MFSYLLLLSSSLIILFPKRDEIKEKVFYSLIFSSFSIASLILGSISLSLVLLGFSKFPIFIISFSILFITLIKDKNSLKKIDQIKIFLNSEVRSFFLNIKKDNLQGIYFISLSVLFILIISSSIGPINHPDSSDYHVGYPYQYFLRGGFFIDGGLTQGLLGISDYANLAYIQEKTIWLIRTSQILNLPLLILFLSNKLRNNLYLIAFLSVPTFIQWSTIGKPLFLGESSIIVVYLIWKEYKTNLTLKFFAITSISCISFKISSLIILLPLFIDIFLSDRNLLNYKRIKYQQVKIILNSKLFLLSVLILLLLLSSRYLITNNFAFPLLTDIFNKNDQLISDFAMSIRNYKKDNLFILNIFVPTTINLLGVSLGPTILTILCGIFFKKIRNINENNNLNYILATQIILLILFGQGRSDYYVSPLILIIYQSDQINYLIKNFTYKFVFFISLTIQMIIISIILSLSIYTNVMTFIDYDEYMNKMAYGYNLSQEIDTSLPGNIYIKGRDTRLYYPKNYVDDYKMMQCSIDYKESGLKASKDICLEKYNINQVILYQYDYINKDLYNCRNLNVYISSRNFFNRSRKIMKYCKNKNL